jgi:hypothetical protein
MKYILFVIVILYTSCTSAQSETNTYFEGEIEFKVEVKSLNSQISQDLLENETGNSMIGKIKRNKYMMQQNTNGELGNTKIIFLLDEGIGYLEYEKGDTIYKYSIEENQDSLIDFHVNLDDKKMILGESCPSVNIKYFPKDNYGIIKYIDAKYYFNDKYKLDEEIYSNHEMNFWNKFVNASNGAISVRNEILTYPLYKTIYEVVKITEKDIPETEFEINKSKVIKNK